MEKAFEFIDIDQNDKGFYVLSGRALVTIVTNELLFDQATGNKCIVKDIIYYGKSISSVDPIFTCILVVHCDSVLNANGMLLK